MKAILAVSLAAAALAAYAGEDSTDRSGIGGTGPAFYTTACGLKGFAGPGGQGPCVAAGAREMSYEEMRAWMAEHMKVMDEAMARIRAEHRAVMGGTAGGAQAGERAH